MSEHFRQIGGARINSINYTWPMVTLVISSAVLELSVQGRKYTFAKEDIDQITTFAGFFSSGIPVKHSNEKYPEFIVFWSFKLKTLLTQLQKLGYEIT